MHKKFPSLNGAQSCLQKNLFSQKKSDLQLSELLKPTKLNFKFHIV